MFIILILKIYGSRHGFIQNAQLNVLGGTADTQHNYHGPIDIQIDNHMRSVNHSFTCNTYNDWEIDSCSY